MWQKWTFCKLGKTGFYQTSKLGGLGLEKKKKNLSHGVANPLSIPKNFPVFIIFLLTEAKNEHLLKPRKTPFYLSMKFGVFGLKKKKKNYIEL